MNNAPIYSTFPPMREEVRLAMVGCVARVERLAGWKALRYGRQECLRYAKCIHAWVQRSEFPRCRPQACFILFRQNPFNHSYAPIPEPRYYGGNHFVFAPAD